MDKYNGYEFLRNECIKFCEKNGNKFIPILALIETPVLGQSIVYCDSRYYDFDVCPYDWWEGGEVKVLLMDYLDELVYKEYERRCKNDSM